MKKIQLFLFCCVLFISCNIKKEKLEYSGKSITTPETISFTSSEGMKITLDLYMAYDISAPLILASHRAQWSRGEYREIAPALNREGFNVIAVDLRSGNSINGIENETNKFAKNNNFKINYVTAEKDLQAAIDFCYKKYAKDKIILMGSSYSAGLGLTLLNKNPKKIKGYLGFSPGEYFAPFGKSYGWVMEEAAKNKNIPVFVTCEKNEIKELEKIFDVIPCKQKYFYKPEYSSAHGAEALFGTTEGNEQTFTEVLSFLQGL